MGMPSTAQSHLVNLDIDLQAPLSWPLVMLVTL